MKRRAAAATVLAALVAAGPAAAADAAGNFALKGAGAAPCAAFSRALAQRSPELTPMLAWIAGYLSAANRYEPATYDLIAWQDERYLIASIERYCARNPAASLAVMTRAMVRSLGPGRLRHQSAPQTIVAGGGQVQLPGELIARMQRQLRARGLYRGAISGRADAALITAIAAFQRRERLPATGLPDQEMLFRLLAPPGPEGSL